jgi:hypothetical protein
MIRDLSEAAEELLCSERWLADKLRAGQFPAKKIGRKWVLSDDDIAIILQICSINHTSTFSADSSVSAAPSTSMTKTTLRRLQHVQGQLPQSGPLDTALPPTGRGRRRDA